MVLDMKDKKSAKEQAEKELKDELFKEATEKYKAQLREIRNAKRILKNLERELEDLEDELTIDESDTSS